MGLFSFIKTAGAKVFGKNKEVAPAEAEKIEPIRAQALVDYVQGLGLPFLELKVYTQADTVRLEGKVAQQADAEKIALAVGNVEGVGSVDNNLVVEVAAPEATFHTVVSGDTLSAIAKKVYGNANKYHQIFEANKPMLKSPDLIYPGQVLRIPAEN